MSSQKRAPMPPYFWFPILISLAAIVLSIMSVAISS